MKSLRMSKHELKDEYKQQEGDPTSNKNYVKSGAIGRKTDDG